MREQVIASLGMVPYDRFLVYLMGPYKSFSADERGEDAALVGADTYDSSKQSGFDAVVTLLRQLQGTLRTDPGVNAFLAVDIGIGIDEMNAVEQSLAFAHVSNAVVFVVPSVGKNLGVGIEVGSVLQDSDLEAQRVLFVHESDVQSAMIRGVGEEWNVTIQRYGDRDELGRKVRLFVRDVMERESRRSGDLERRT